MFNILFYIFEPLFVFLKMDQLHRLSPTERPKRIRKKADIVKRNLSKYPLLPPCKSSCPFQCSERLDEDHRQDIRSIFRSKLFDGRRPWLDANISILNVKQRKTTSNLNLRNNHLLYTLPAKDGTKIRVCKVMFMATLGAKSDSIIMEFVRAKRENAENAISPSIDRRGRKRKAENHLHEAIINHINSYNPCVSHYRREHAPNRRYLEAHLNVKGQ